MFDHVQSLYDTKLDFANSGPDYGTNREIGEEEGLPFRYLYDLFRTGFVKIDEKIKYYKRKFFVKKTNYLPPWILGMTDCRGNIWIRRLYGYLLYNVLRHEINHNLHPEKNEYEIQRMTYAGEPRDLSPFELIFV